MTEEEILEIGVQAGMNPAIMLLDGNFKLLKNFAKLVAEKATAELRSDIKINQRNLLQKLTRGQE
jgi:hypothetical protein